MHEDIAHAKALWKRYTDEVLVPSAVTLARAIREQQSVNQQSTTNRLADSDDENWANTDTMGLCYDSDNDVDGEPIDDFELKLKVETELKLFRKASDLPSFACKKTSPLTWWRAHATLYPSLANLARIVLGVPGSQIECERIFSLAGLLTSRLRNRMSPERLDDIVFLSKNLDIDEALNSELTVVYGEKAWESSRHMIGSLPEAARSDIELNDPECEGGVNWHVMESLLEEDALGLDM